jgi:hypothetical protein
MSDDERGRSLTISGGARKFKRKQNQEENYWAVTEGGGNLAAADRRRDMEGYLEKMHGGRKLQRQHESLRERVRLAGSIISARHSSIRFFQLKAGADGQPLLHYYKTESDCILGRLRGVIDCRECRVTMDADASTFVVYTHGRDLTLRAESREDARRWADAIAGSGRAELDFAEPVVTRTPTTSAVVSPAPPAPPLARQAPAPAGDFPPTPRREAAPPIARAREPWEWMLQPAVEVATILACSIGVAAWLCGRAILTLFKAAKAGPSHLLSGAERLTQAVCGDSSSKVSPQGDESCCVVCMDAEPTHAMIPCGHRCVCGRCARRLDSCPLCRKRCTSSLRIFA